MNLRNFTFMLIATFWFSGDLHASSALKVGSVGQIVDFGIIYPYLNFKDGMEKTQKVTAGVSANYYFYFWRERLGLSGNIYAWFQPVRATVDSRQRQETLYSVGLEIGPSYRFFPKSYFDPVIAAQGGIAAVDAGGSRQGKFSPTASGKFGINLWRQQQKFMDNDLAFHFSGSFVHHFNMVANSISKNVLVFGLFFRGSF